MEQIRITVYGHVQGVFFRRNTKNIAVELGLNGWVRNNTDGTVEIVAQGPKKKLLSLLEWSKIGEVPANVQKVDYEFEPLDEVFDNFLIVR